MAKTTTHFVCQSCGATAAKWAGRCEACGEWNTMVEEVLPQPVAGGRGSAVASARRGLSFVTLDGPVEAVPRRRCGIGELDRVLGGGLVPGAAILISGDPGIGKSTLLIQALAALAGNGVDAYYVSGEESVDQVRLRAHRLGLDGSSVRLAAETNIRDIVSTLEKTPADRPAVAVIDSIQTMRHDGLEGAPGTVSQVRACGQELIQLAKRRGIAVIIVGHVTKEGQIAGPRLLEHMVDTVLHFEGERGHAYRILRAVKNRFGATDEIGVFSMTDLGLMEVENPSAIFLGDRDEKISGSAVFAGLEGTRPVLVEIQALVAASALGTPRRTVVGWDGGRLAMILAVLDARCGLSLGSNDVYLNVAGGLRILEPAADLAVAAALLSSLTDRALPKETVVLGEVGLSGEVRAVSQMEARLKEAAKLGFTRAFVPKAGVGRQMPVEIRPLKRLAELVELFVGPNGEYAPKPAGDQAGDRDGAARPGRRGQPRGTID